MKTKTTKKSITLTITTIIYNYKGGTNYCNAYKYVQSVMQLNSYRAELFQIHLSSKLTILNNHFKKDLFL